MNTKKRNCKNCYMHELKGKCMEIGFMHDAIIKGYCKHHKYYSEYLGIVDKEPKKYYAC